MLLQAPIDLKLPRGTEAFLSRLRLNLSPGDAMYQGNDRHYLSCGASALNVILTALQLADVPDPATILDFGAGAGRVTRWLRAAFPNAALDVCDLRQQDLDFCRDEFGARSWTSGTEISSLNAPGRYDLIWLGSVATHLPAAQTVQMLKKMLSWTNRAGLAVISFHGRHAFDRHNSGDIRYIHDEGWNLMKNSYAESGYGYAEYLGYNGYGVSITKPSWIAGLVENWSDAKLVALAESAWDGHHDVLAVQSV